MKFRELKLPAQGDKSRKSKNQDSHIGPVLVGTPQQSWQITNSTHLSFHLASQCSKPKSSSLSFMSAQKENWTSVCSSSTKNPPHDIHSIILYVKPSIWLFYINPIILPGHLIYWLSTTYKVLRLWLQEGQLWVKMWPLFQRAYSMVQGLERQEKLRWALWSKANDSQKNTMKELYSKYHRNSKTEESCPFAERLHKG